MICVLGITNWINQLNCTQFEDWVYYVQRSLIFEKKKLSTGFYNLYGAGQLQRIHILNCRAAWKRWEWASILFLLKLRSEFTVGECTKCFAMLYVNSNKKTAHKYWFWVNFNMKLHRIVQWPILLIIDTAQNHLNIFNCVHCIHCMCVFFIFPFHLIYLNSMAWKLLTRYTYLSCNRKFTFVNTIKTTQFATTYDY